MVYSGGFGIGQGLAGAGQSIAGAITQWQEQQREQQQQELRAKFFSSLLGGGQAEAPIMGMDAQGGMTKTGPTVQSGGGNTGLKKLFGGMDPKDLAQLFGSESFTPQGLMQLIKLGDMMNPQAGSSGPGLITGEELMRTSPGRFGGRQGLKGYIFQQDPESGKLSALVTPERPFALAPGSILTTADGDPIAKAPERVQVQGVSPGGQLILIDPNDKTGTLLYASPPAPKDAGDDLGMSRPIERTRKARDPVTGEMVETTDTFEFVPRKGGGGFIRGNSPLMQEEKREPLTKPEAGAVQGARQGLQIVKEVRELLLPTKGKDAGKLNTGALASKAIGLPGAVAPEGASITPKILQAIDPYVRLTTGAALNEQELANANRMFVPSITDGKELVQDKLNRLEQFLSGDLNLMGMIAAPGSPVASWVWQKNAGGGSGAAAAPAAAPSAPAAPPSAPAAPQRGEVQSGYRFKGGDPSKRENWEKVK